MIQQLSDRRQAAPLRSPSSGPAESSHHYQYMTRPGPSGFQERPAKNAPPFPSEADRYVLQQTPNPPPQRAAEEACVCE